MRDISSKGLLLSGANEELLGRGIPLVRFAKLTRTLVAQAVGPELLLAGSVTHLGEGAG